jgi:hypothetical protein
LFCSVEFFIVIYRKKGLMGQSLETLGGSTISDVVDAQEWLTEGCAYASKSILKIYEPQMRSLLQRWKDNTKESRVNQEPVFFYDQYSTLVYKIAEELLGQCTQGEVEVFVLPGWCLRSTDPTLFCGGACE